MHIYVYDIMYDTSMFERKSIYFSETQQRGVKFQSESMQEDFHSRICIWICLHTVDHFVSILKC